MKIFPLRNRATNKLKSLPHVRVGVAHLTGPGKLSVDQENLIFENSDCRQARLDIEGLREVIAYGEVHVTTSVMSLLQQNQIALSWVSRNGCFLRGRLAHDTSEKALTRLLQYQAWEDRQWQLTMARETVYNKLKSIQSALRHYQRQGKKIPNGTLKEVENRIAACRTTTTVDQLRGIEGNASAIWFSQFSKLLSRGWVFNKRSRRPPRDPANSLLSFGYMHLYRRVAARIEAGGYEASLGALHEFRPGRQSMACDLMEPLRIGVVDRWVIAVCNQGIVKPSEFETTESGGVVMIHQHMGKVLTLMEEHWHQGHFDQILDQSLSSWTESIRGQVTSGTSRAASYLKRRVLLESREGTAEDQGWSY